LASGGLFRTVHGVASRAAIQGEEQSMPRYMVERTVPRGFDIRINEDGSKAVQAVVDANSRGGVTWVHAYLSTDKHETYCIDDRPSPEAIQGVAAKNVLPVSWAGALDSIVEVGIVDPYLYS
jgi:hypothetical protein